MSNPGASKLGCMRKTSPVQPERNNLPPECEYLVLAAKGLFLKTATLMTTIFQNPYPAVLYLLALVWSWSFQSAQAQNSIPSGRPNIVFILIDDMGVEMTNSYGSEGLVSSGTTPYLTPHIDAFSAQSMRFTHAFATPSCAPTRAQFLTGRYPFRTGVVYPTLTNGELRENELSLARVLQAEGYHTGVAGKWNLKFGKSAKHATNEDKQLQTEHIRLHGFDESFTFVGHTIDYGSASPETSYVPYNTNQWVLDFLQANANQPVPFFLQYSLGLIHTPWDPTPLNPQGGTREENYLKMIEYMDQLIGKVLQKIEALHIAETTLVIVAGDNGTHASITSRFNSIELRGQKLKLWDLGSWVPFMVRWPGVIEAGSDYSGLMDFSDVFPTLIEAAGGTIPEDRVIDGISFLPQLLGKTEPHRNVVYCQMKDRRFVRNNSHKLVVSGDPDLAEGLYDVSNSPYEEIFLEEPFSPAQQVIKDALQEAYDALTGT
jgi:arylsulfatase A